MRVFYFHHSQTCGIQLSSCPNEQASSKIVRSFADPAQIKRSYDQPIEKFIDDVKAMGAGVYIVGLDNHVGFIVVEPDQGSKLSIRFVHSSYYLKNPYVLSEPVTGSNPLNDSRLREVGKIFGDDLIEKWIKNEEVKIP